MRRLILTAASAVALAAALSVGPFGASAAAPYVYGCTPADFNVVIGSYGVETSIYNGSASTANLTIKILALDGSILNNTEGSYYAVPISTTVAATHTFVNAYINPDPTTGHTLASAVRIVSNVPVSATITHQTSQSPLTLVPIYCSPQQP